MADAGFGELLRRLRVSAGLTQEGLAERSGISAKAISDLERDPARKPRLDSVVALSEALGQDADGRALLLAAARPGVVAARPPRGGAAPSRLPCPPNPLIGRAGVVRTLVDLVRERRYRLVTVSGPGGVGKTRVAMEVAGQLAADFPDGVVPVDLTPAREVPEVESRIAAALDVTDEGPMSLWERVVSAVGDRMLLLLLDNVEQVVRARTRILELLAACPGLTVLVTSRIPLAVRGERVYRIAPLELPPLEGTDQPGRAYAAVVLFRERAEAAGVEIASDPDTDAAIIAICRHLDGLPLAIELAAARSAVLHPAALLARLRHRLPVLTDGPHDLPTRQRTMRDAIAWSYDLLTPAEQRLFRQVSVFTGGFDETAIAAVATEAEGGVLDLLSGLTRQNMLRPLTTGDPSRMTMLETIREYGLERLDAAGETDTIHTRHARYFAELVRGGAVPPHPGPEPPDIDNVRAALSWAVATGHTAIALDIGGALWRYWSRRGQLTEGRRWLEAILRLPDVETNVSALTEVLVGATTLAVEQGAFDRACELCGPAVEAARRSHDRADLMLALTAQGLIARHRSRHPDAVAAYEEALALAIDLNDMAAVAKISVGLAYVTSISGDLERAAALTEQADAAARDLADPRARADMLQMLAWLAFHGRQPDRVDAYGNEALALYRDLGESGQLAEVMRVLGTSASTCGRYREAEALLAESYALHRDRGDEFRAGVVAAVQAHTALNLGDFAQGQLLAETSLEASRRYDDPWAIAMSLLLSGHLALAQQATGHAFELFAEATRLMLEFGNPLYLSWCAEGVMAIAADRRDWDRAARLCRVREAIIAKTGSLLPPIRQASFTDVIQLIQAHTTTPSPEPVGDPLHELERIITELATNPGTAIR